MSDAAMMLAQQALPPVVTDGGFFSLGKLLFMTIFVFLWGWPAGWVCRDAARLSLNSFLWGLIVAGTSTVAWLCWLMFPNYLVGFLFCLLLGCGGVLAYALYRDSIVEEENKILRPANLLKAIKGEQPEEAFKFEVKVRLIAIQGMERIPPKDDESQRIYQVFQNMLFDALWRRASDMQVQPHGENVVVYFKIDGVRSEYSSVPREQGLKLIDCIKRAGGLNVEERRQPQSGSMLASQVGVDRKVRLDFESSGSTAGEKIRLRVRAEEAKYTVNEVGFTKEQIDQLRPVLDAERGLIVLSGMGGSGISTSLYAFARSHDAFTKNIHSVEAKPLMEMDNITQNVYQSGQGQSFARLLQSVSRREPDIIIVDPCADAETIAMIGQLVADRDRKILTTMRASNTLSALGRTMRWVGQPDRAGDVLLAITYQRLVRKLCPACKEPYRPNPDMLRKLNMSAKTDVTFYRPPSQQVVDKKGNPIICPTCQGTGYLGRTAVYELLVVDKDLAATIATGDGNAVKAAARKSGFRYWQEVAIEQVIAGVTSVQEVIRVSKEAEAKAAG